jgi:predicted transcriptional regulator
MMLSYVEEAMDDKMRFTFWLDKTTVATLEKMGEKQDRPVSWFIRQAVEEYIVRQKGTSR